MSTARNSKYKYCPEYDDFLVESKQKLQERLTHHHNLREPLIHKAVLNTINEIETFGYETFIDEHIPDYSPSFINKKQIETYINEWSGPEISNQYVSEFDNIEHKNYQKIIKFDKFHKDAVNWQDQSSYKVTGKYFFATHISKIRKYLTKYCNNIINITENEKRNIINYSCIYCAVQILSMKTRFKRSKQQPLIRHTTLRDSKELHNSFKILYKELNLSKLKDIVKKNNKSDPKKKGGNRYRVNSTEFAENVIIYANNLLEKEKRNMDLSDNTNSDLAMPEYFKYKKDKTDMDIEMNNTNTNKNTPHISPPPKPTPPPKPSPPTPIPSIYNNEWINNNNNFDDCVCPLPPPVYHGDGTKTIFVPRRINQNENPSVYYNGYMNMEYNGYNGQRGVAYMTNGFRYGPYNIPMRYPNVIPPMIPPHVLPLPATFPPVNNDFINGMDGNGNYENISDTSSLTYSSQSQFPNNSQEAHMFTHY